ncbi:unnamed protein product, partial [Nesidiocoris tenuis]
MSAYSLCEIFYPLNSYRDVLIGSWNNIGSQENWRPVPLHQSTGPQLVLHQHQQTLQRLQQQTTQPLPLNSNAEFGPSLPRRHAPTSKIPPPVPARSRPPATANRQRPPPPPRPQRSGEPPLLPIPGALPPPPQQTPPTIIQTGLPPPPVIIDEAEPTSVANPTINPPPSYSELYPISAQTILRRYSHGQVPEHREDSHKLPPPRPNPPNRKFSEGNLPSDMNYKFNNKRNATVILPPPIQTDYEPPKPDPDKISERQDSNVSSDSFSQTSSPSYTTKSMEAPLLPSYPTTIRYVNRTVTATAKPITDINPAPDCDLFPESSDPDVCIGHREVEEAERRAQKPVRLSDRMGDEGFGKLEVFQPDLQSWRPACVKDMNNWGPESPKAVCNSLGYS